MNCERIRELIMTDYGDGEAGGELKREIEMHLNACAACRRFKEALEKAAFKPFKEAEKVKAPAFLWSRIKERIASEKTQPEGLLVNVRRGLSGIVKARKPAFAVAAVVAILLMTIIVARIPFDSRRAVSEYLAEQAEFIGYLAFNTADTYNSDSADFDTSIEEYLL